MCLPSAAAFCAPQEPRPGTHAHNKCDFLWRECEWSTGSDLTSLPHFHSSLLPHPQLAAASGSAPSRDCSVPLCQRSHRRMHASANPVSLKQKCNTHTSANPVSLKHTCSMACDVAYRLYLCRPPAHTDSSPSHPANLAGQQLVDNATSIVHRSWYKDKLTAGTSRFTHHTPLRKAYICVKRTRDCVAVPCM